MVYYCMKKFFWLKKNIIYYVDWGIGFDYLGGVQKIDYFYLVVDGSVLNIVFGMVNFYNGYVYGWFIVYCLLKIVGNVYFDYGLGLNVGYQVLLQFVYDVYYEIVIECYQKFFVFQVYV